jgi:aryl-phospho-beta-D-glucosidase BglC (GH1 family)
MSPVAKNGHLSISSDGLIKNKLGRPVSFAGNSLFWSNDYYRGNSFYNKDVIAWLHKDWKSDIIRIPMAADPDIHDSYVFSPEHNVAKVKTVVDACLNLGLYVIIDWHSHKAELNEREAVKFFTEMATKYGKYPNVIYEIYNEPLKQSWKEIVKPYSENLISAIRKIDPDNIIVVGSPHWSQDVDNVAKDPITGYKNIAYTLHFYAGSHFKWLMDKAQKAVDAKLPMIVTEWGSVNADGNGAVNYEWTEKWMQFMRKNNLTHCVWAVNDKEEGSSIVKKGSSISGGWKDDDLTESGKLAKAYIMGWQK